MDRIPRLVQVHAELPANTALIGITAAEEFELFQLNQEYRLPYPLLAKAQPLLDAYGIEWIWGSVFYLIDPEGRVLAADLEPSVAAAHAAGP